MGLKSSPLVTEKVMLRLISGKLTCETAVNFEGRTSGNRSGNTSATNSSIVQSSGILHTVGRDPSTAASFFLASVTLCFDFFSMCTLSSEKALFVFCFDGRLVDLITGICKISSMALASIMSSRWSCSSVGGLVIGRAGVPGVKMYSLALLETTQTASFERIFLSLTHFRDNFLGKTNKFEALPRALETKSPRSSSIIVSMQVAALMSSSFSGFVIAFTLWGREVLPLDVFSVNCSLI